MIPAVKYSAISFVLSGVATLAAVVLLFVYGLQPGIDFTGGSLLEVTYLEGRPSIEEAQTTLAPLGLGTVSIQPTGGDGFIVKSRFLSEEEHQAVLLALRSDLPGAETLEAASSSVAGVADDSSAPEEGGAATTTPSAPEDATPRVVEERFETIGPSVSAQLRQRSIAALVLVVLMIVVFIAYAFRKVARPVPSWAYGIAAVVALVHTILITLGVFAWLGASRGVEVDIPFIVALLTILGYCINDTIVVFDRVRENLITQRNVVFPDLVTMAVNQTIMRSVNTSMITLLVLVGLYFFGGASIHYFSLALIIGIFVGTYASIFLASPLLVVWYRVANRQKE